MDDDMSKYFDWRYNHVFRQSFEMVIEVELYTGKCVQTLFSDWFSAHKIQGDSYRQFYLTAIDERVYIEDVEKTKQMFSLEQLLYHYENDREELVFQFRIKFDEQDLIWVESKVIYIDGVSPCAFITIRDITKIKKAECRQRIADQYDIALRNIYDELYELNITKDRYCIKYHVKDKYVMPPESGVLSDTLALVSEQMVHPDDQQRFRSFLDLEQLRKNFSSGKESVIGEFRKLWIDGNYHWSSLTILPIQDHIGKDQIFLCFVMDIDYKKQTVEVLEQNKLLQQKQYDDERYRIIVEQTGTLVVEWNCVNGNHYYSLELQEELCGNYDGRDLFLIWIQDEVIHPDDLNDLDQISLQMREGKCTPAVTIRLKNRDQNYRWYKLVLSSLLDENGVNFRVIGTINDVDEVVKYENTLKYRAEYDALTGIYNVEAFYCHAKRMMEENPDKKYAIIRMDINRFKFVNDIYGIEEGDRLLCYIASVLQHTVSDSDSYGRVAGDVFCACVAFQEEHDLIDHIQEIITHLRSYKLGYKIIPFFGICMVDDRKIPVSILCDWANLALRTVKGNMVKTWAFYDDKLRAKQLEERKIEEEMEDALNEGQFVIYLQPKHNLQSSRIVGAESLVRWIHPKDGILSPFQFIPLFERNGFIVQLDEYVWEATCKALRNWMNQGYEPVPISINVSRVHIYNKNFCSRLIAIADKYQIPRDLLELELTESTFIENPENLYETMRLLQSKGFSFSMDDFGSGYSSLNMLKNTPVNTIKLDREFLNETVATQKGQTVIQYTISMVKELDLNIVAEGVETEKQAKFLLDAGCITAQGYYFSKPMPLHEFEQLVFS